MNDQPHQVREAPSDMPLPAAPKMYKYRVRALNGECWDFASPWEFTFLWSWLLRDGYLVTSSGFMPYHAIGTLMRLPDDVPIGGNVVQLVTSNEPKHG